MGAFKGGNSWTALLDLEKCGYFLWCINQLFIWFVVTTDCDDAVLLCASFSFTITYFFFTASIRTFLFEGRFIRIAIRFCAIALPFPILLAGSV